MQLLHLERNENLYGPSPECRRALREADPELLNLYSRSYLKSSKSELSERLSAESGIPEKQILLGDGSEDLLKQAVQCYLPPGATLLVPENSWWYYHALAAEVKGRSAVFPLHDLGDRFAYDAGAIREAYDQHSPRIILIASPNNPTGHSVTPEAVDEIARHCDDAVIVLDQAYVGFTEDTADPIAELLAAHPRLVALRTFSKYYALAGLRIGYAFAGAGLEKLIAVSQRYLGFNRISESIALAALDHPAYFREIAGHVIRDRQMLCRNLNLIQGLRCYRSDANFVLVRYEASMRSLLERGLKERGIFVKFLSDPGLDDCMRITIGRTDQNLIVIEALQSIVRNLPPTPNANLSQ